MRYSIFFTSALLAASAIAAPADNPPTGTLRVPAGTPPGVHDSVAPTGTNWQYLKARSASTTRRASTTPTFSPTGHPTGSAPTDHPTGSDRPTGSVPKDRPTGSDRPTGTDHPTGSMPTDHPTGTDRPTGSMPTDHPTGTDRPTGSMPTDHPTGSAPSDRPTGTPTFTSRPTSSMTWTTSRRT